MDINFNNHSGLRLRAAQVVGEIVDFIKDDPEQTYRVIIGTDSEAMNNGEADFVTAIVVHRQGHGGRYFWRRLNGGKFYTMRDRIIKEVMISLEVAKEILGALESRVLTENWGFEIHADIGANGPTKDLIQEVVGMIRANNFEVRTKPEGYAASKVADRHV